MIYQLFQRDPAWRTARWAIPIIALAGIPHRSNGVTGALMAVTGLNAALASHGLFRATLFHAALPVSGRQLFQARLLACLTLATGPLFAAALVHLLIDPAGLPVAISFLAMGAVLAFLTLFALSLKIDRFSPPARLSSTLIWTSVVALPLIYWQAAAWPVLFAALAACLIRWVTISPRIPKCFQAAPLEPAESETRSTHSPVRASSYACWALIRASISWQAWMMAAVVLILPSPFFGVLFGFGIPNTTRVRARWLTGLPVSPRALLALMLLPYLVPLAVGYAVAGNFGLASDRFPRLSAIPRYGSTIEVPLEYWRHAPAGIAPEIQAPWGESFHPPVTSILGYALYNPFAAGRSNSTRFLHWQVSRAAEAIYGKPVSYGQAMAQPRAPGLTPLTMQPRSQILGTALLLALALGIELVWCLFAWRRFPGPPLRNILLGVLLVALFGVIGVGFLLPQSISSLPFALLNRLLLDLLRWLPDSLPAALAVAVLLVVVPYLIVEKLFKESEFPNQSERAGPFGRG